MSNPIAFPDTCKFRLQGCLGQFNRFIPKNKTLTEGRTGLKIVCMGDSRTEGDYGVLGKSGIANVTWRGRRQDWSLIHAQMAIYFAERMPE